MKKYEFLIVDGEHGNIEKLQNEGWKLAGKVKIRKGKNWTLNEMIIPLKRKIKNNQ